MNSLELKQELNAFSKALTVESPVKVMGLLSTALMSLAFLFVVSFTNASFEGTREYFPDPFSQQNVVAVLDSTSFAYSNFIQTALTEPLASDLAMYKENLDWVIDNSDTAILSTVGLDKFAYVDTVKHEPKVAGAFIRNSSQFDLVDAIANSITQQ